MPTQTSAEIKLSFTDGNRSHALVIGGGIAGLLAARVLADHFEQVTIIERDHFPDVPQHRQGVPQSTHCHVLLVQGRIILEQLFPGIKEKLSQNDALEMDWTQDIRWLLLGNWTPRFASGLRSYTCTRNLLETIIREFLTEEKKIKFLQGYQVTSLLSSEDNRTVKGVRVRSVQEQETEILAQFILDASGRGSNATQWLQSLGYERPQETIVKSFLGYSTRWYRFPVHRDQDYKLFYLMPQAPNFSRGAVMQNVEQDRWLVTLIGVGRDYPPTDEADFLEFTRHLQSLEVYEAIKDAEPLSPIYGYRRTENRWYHYEWLSHLPENFVLLGDAVCAFNPVYGQGMSNAALSAITLSECLKQPTLSEGFSLHFQKKLAKVNKNAWLIATGDDFRWPTTEGGNPNFINRLMQRYLDRVILATRDNPQVYQALLEVLHLLKSPSSLFQAQILFQALMPRKTETRR